MILVPKKFIVRENSLLILTDSRILSHFFYLKIQEDNMENVIIILVAALEMIHYAILFSKQLAYVTNTGLDILVTKIR